MKIQIAYANILSFHKASQVALKYPDTVGHFQMHIFGGEIVRLSIDRFFPHHRATQLGWVSGFGKGSPRIDHILTQL